MRLQQHRNIEVSGATFSECTVYGSGTPVVLLANAGCSTGYFCDLARVLAAGGLQTISVNMRGVGESRGSLDGITVHDLAADVAGVLEAVDCGPAHLVGHAFGNRVARCLAVDRPSLVRSVTLLAAGGLIGPATPLGTSFRNATEVKMNGSDCVTVLGALAVAGVGSENTCAGRMLAGGASRPSRDQPGYGARRLVECRNSPASRDPGAR